MTTTNRDRRTPPPEPGGNQSLDDLRHHLEGMDQDDLEKSLADFWVGLVAALVLAAMFYLIVGVAWFGLPCIPLNGK